MTSLRDHRDFPASWCRDPFDRDNRIDALVGDVAALGPMGEDSSWSEDSLACRLAEIGRFIASATRLETISVRDYDALETSAATDRLTVRCVPAAVRRAPDGLAGNAMGLAYTRSKASPPLWRVGTAVANQGLERYCFSRLTSSSDQLRTSVTSIHASM